MRALGKLTWIELKLFLREPVGAFFTLVFPLIILFIFGGIFGNAPSPELGGRGSVDISVPAYSAMVIGTVGLIGLPIVLASYRELGILRRLRATPLPAWKVLAAQLIVNLLMTTLGMALLIVAARLVYGLRLPDAPLAVALAFVLASLSFCAAGFVLASLLRSARLAQVVGMALLYPMLFLSGAALPREIMPPTVRRLSEFLPLTHVTILMQDLWFGRGWNLTAVAVLAALLTGGALISARAFRWE